MPALIAPKPTGSNFAPAPEGLHIARCIAMVDLGTHEDTGGKFGPKRQRKLRLSFELPDEKAVFNEEKGEQPYVVSQEFTFSMHEKAKLRGFLEAWRGKKFTDKEADEFDISKLLAVPAMVNVMHTPPKNGRVYANISTATRLPKNTVCPEQITPATAFALAEFEQDTFDSLPEWMRTKIADSDEYKAMVAAEEKKAGGENQSSFRPPTDDDDIPF